MATDEVQYFSYLFHTAVDFRKWLRLSRGRHSWASSGYALRGLKNVAIPPQDKEGCDSDTSHAENACIFKESSPIAPINS